MLKTSMSVPQIRRTSRIEIYNQEASPLPIGPIDFQVKADSLGVQNG